MTDVDKVPTSLFALLDGSSSLIYLSMVSAWEIAIKHGKGRLDLSLPFDEFVFKAPARRGIELLLIEPRHVSRYDRLEFLDPKHPDPFDRMLVAQALADGLTLVSRDTRLDAYGVSRLWDGA